MPRLVSQQGVVVNVSDEKAERLGSGWTPVAEPQPAKKTARSSAKSDSK
jgi:hypothetical protein